MQIIGKEFLIKGQLFRVAQLDAEGYDSMDDPELAIKMLRECGTRIDLLTFIQKISETSPKYAYRLEWDNFAVLKVSTFDEWIAHQIDFKTRNKVRKSAKNGVVVREVAFGDDLINGISAIYNESPVRQGKAFWHYGKDIGDVRRMNGTFMERSIFIGAFFENRLIGFVKLVTNEEGSQAGLMQIVSMIRHRDKAPTNALIAQSVRSCADRGIPTLWYANFSYGKKEEDSLAEFKRHNGFSKINVPRYYVPLTPLGRVGLRIGLHHNATEWIPEPLSEAYRSIRSRWYARMYQTRRATPEKSEPVAS